ncbi:hypothetical protein SLA2020_282990 [Shorea laevis]
MVRRTTRSRGAKKNTKLIEQVMLDSIDDVSLPVDHDAIPEDFAHHDSLKVSKRRSCDKAGNQFLVSDPENVGRNSDPVLNRSPPVSNLERPISPVPILLRSDL